MAMYNFTESALNETFSVLNHSEESEITYETLVRLFRNHKISELYGKNVSTLFSVNLAICLIGFLTNIFNIIVFSRPKMANSMNMFLLVLSVADLLFIVTQFSQIIHYYIGMPLYPFYNWVYFYFINIYLETSLLHSCNWLVAMIGVWRFVGVTWPLRSKELCSKHRTKVVIAIIFVCCFVLSAVLFLQLTCEKVEYNDYTFYDVSNSDLAKANNYAFSNATAVLRFLEFALPMLLMVVVTFLLIRNLYLMRRQRQVELNICTPASKNHRITIMLSILVSFYFLGNIPDCLMNLVNLINQEMLNTYRDETDFVRFFIISTNTCSFFIYYGLSKEFRQTFNNILVQPVVSIFKELTPFRCIERQVRGSVATVDTIVSSHDNLNLNNKTSSLSLPIE